MEPEPRVGHFNNPGEERDLIRGTDDLPSRNWFKDIFRWTRERWQNMDTDQKAIGSLSIAIVVAGAYYLKIFSDPEVVTTSRVILTALGTTGGLALAIGTGLFRKPFRR